MVVQPVIQSVTMPLIGGVLGNPLSRYVTAGRVLDYSTVVGPFTIVDKSPEGNTATLYSGRGVSMDGVNDYITCPTATQTFSYYWTGKIRSATTGIKYLSVSPDSSVYAINVTTANVWQEFTTTHSGDFRAMNEFFIGWNRPLNTFSEADWSDVRCLRSADDSVIAHFTLADWSDPTADGLDGKTIVDSGPDGFHGTCTGCSGFTGEGIDPDVVGIVGLDDKMYFDGADDYVQLDSTISLAVGEYVEATCYWQNGDRIYLAEDTPVTVDFLTVTDTGAALFRLDGVIYTHTEVVTESGQTILRLERTAASSYTLTVNGSSEGFATTNAPISLRQIGGTSNIGLYFTGLTLSVDYNGTAVWTNTGTSSGAGYTVNGNPATVGQKRATIPQTADRNWNRATPKSNDLTVGWVEAGASTIIDSNTFETSDGAQGVYLGTITGRSYEYTVTGTTTGAFQIWDWGGGGGILETKTGAGSFSFTGTYTSAGTSLQFYIRASASSITVDFDTLHVAEIGMMIPASDADDQIDALGNPILEPRLNNQQLNLFGEGEYSRTADSDSLDLTTEATWEIWGNFYDSLPQINELLSKWKDLNRSFRIACRTADGDGFTTIQLSGDGTAASVDRIAITDKYSQIVFVLSGSAITAYVDGASSTVTHISGTIPASLFAGDGAISIGAGERAADTFAAFSDDKIGSAKLYNVALTADEVLQNFNAQKSKYGL